jgi:hypothetical protein
MRPTNQTTYSSLPMLRPHFKVFTAYENLAAYTQARKIQDQLKSLVNDEIEILNVALKFPLFRHEESWKHAVAEAATADMIIISATGEDLPFPVQSWVETWPRREQSGQAALVIVLDSQPEREAGEPFLAAYFRRVAEDRQLDFFYNQDRWERPETVLPRWQTDVPMPIIPLALTTSAYPLMSENRGIND